MMTMRRQIGLATTIAVVLSVAACSNGSAPSSDLARDLQMAESSSLTLAPQAGQTEVVSAAERTPQVKPAPRPAAPERQAAAPASQSTSMAAVAPAPVAPAPAPARSAPEAVPAATPAPRPAPRPVQQQPPRGGWKTVGDVIRNAPFPINP